MKKPILLQAIIRSALLVCIVPVFAAAQTRQAVHIDSSLGYPRLLTDTNSTLRGVSIAEDGGYGFIPNTPSQGQFSSLANDYGLNMVHVYLERYSQDHTQAGYNYDNAVAIVNNATAAGLYVILTIGGGNDNSLSAQEVQFSVDFWNLYAPLFANNPNVLYELHNEPGPYNPNFWSDTDRSNQILLYKTVRNTGATNHILLFTFGSTVNTGAIAYDVSYATGQGVDWTRASVAFHSYDSPSTTQNALTGWISNPLPSAFIATEFDATNNTSSSADEWAYTAEYEAAGVGWAQFTWLLTDNNDLANFKTQIQANQIVWTPDFGNWPQ